MESGEMYSFIFSNNDDNSQGYIGGIVNFDTSNNLNLGAELVPFITLKPDFFPTKILDEDELLTVFLNKKLFLGDKKNQTLRSLTINDSSQSCNEENYKVYKYKKGDINFPLSEDKLPEIFFNIRDFDKDEMAQELEDDDSGAQLSKVLGRMGYLQDDISFGMKYKFLLQIFEDDLISSNDFFNGIFRDGAIYLFIDKNIKKIKYGENLGKVFIQFL